MEVFVHPEFDHHEQVVFFSDAAAGLHAIVAIHNTVRGPALGGCRMYPYADEEAALTDVLRLAKGMTYKSAISELPLGGGKAVIIGDPRRDKTEALFKAFGCCLERLGGHYIVAEDSGTSVEDLRIIASQTRYISGIGERPMPNGGTADGDPSPATAYGVFKGIESAVTQIMGAQSLRGIKVAVQGVGNVGRRLLGHLTEAGAVVCITDVYQDRLAEVRNQFDVEIMDAEKIYHADVDVLSPCALGAVLNDRTIKQMRAKIIAGAANNQLAESRHAESLQQRGICYVPDFVINAGGVIDIAGYQAGLSYSESMQQVERIHATVLKVLQESEATQETTLAVAERMALANLKKQ